MIEINDFKKQEKNYAAKYSVEGKPVSVYVYQPIENDFGINEDENFAIFGYAKGCNIKNIGVKSSLNEVNEFLIDFCKDLEIAYAVTNNPNLCKFLEKQSDKHLSFNRSECYRVYSNSYKEDHVEMYVRWEQKLLNGRGGYLPMVVDVEINTNDLREGQLNWAVPTKEEAISIVDAQMVKYNTEGCYDRNLKRAARNTFLHESKSLPEEDFIEEYYIFGDGERTDLTKEQYSAIVSILNG